MLSEKMDWMSQQVRRAQKVLPLGASTARLRQIQTHLYNAQINDTSTRQIQAGSPLRALRRELYRSLLRAERGLDELLPDPLCLPAGRAAAVRWPKRSETLLRSPVFTLLVDRARGARITELSDKQAERNLLDTRVRCGGQESEGGWRDHLFPPQANVCGLSDPPGAEDPLSDARWSVRLEESPKGPAAVFSARAGRRFEIKKGVRIHRSERKLEFSHRLRNVSSKKTRLLYGTEFNWNLKDAHVNRSGEAEGIRRFCMIDPEAMLQLSFQFSRPARITYFPREKVLADGGRAPQRVFEGISLTALWELSLAPNQEWIVNWVLSTGEPNGGC